MNLSASPHVPFRLATIRGGYVEFPLPCLQCILDGWAIRARHGARAGVAYRVGSTNWARRPVRAQLLPRFKPDKR